MILIALGANLPGFDGSSPLTTCRRAVSELAALPGLQLVAVSRWYASEPIPPSGQPPYVNGVARLAGEAEPAALLTALQALEAAAGRRRTEANAARPLDLDIIAMSGAMSEAMSGPTGGLVRDAPDPVLPHPRAHLRAFVLAPLCDVAPDWVHPRLGLTAAAMLAALPPQACRLL